MVIIIIKKMNCIFLLFLLHRLMKNITYQQSSLFHNENITSGIDETIYNDINHIEQTNSFHTIFQKFKILNYLNNPKINQHNKLQIIEKEMNEILSGKIVPNITMRELLQDWNFEF